MSYEAALKAAGMKVLRFENFGSYQGDWYAEVLYDGEHGFIHGSFGSCSSCDSFEAEFGHVDTECDYHQRNYKSAGEYCAECQLKRNEYNDRLADFGRGYLPVLSLEQVLEPVRQNLSWDSDAENVLRWLMWPNPMPLEEEK